MEYVKLKEEESKGWYGKNELVYKEIEKKEFESIKCNTIVETPVRDVFKIEVEETRSTLSSVRQEIR